MLHISTLHNIYLSETQPFRKVHRMIDLFETIIKTHTAVMMGEYFKHNQISDTAKGMLAAGLRTPSLGTWQLFSRELYKELKQAGHVFLCKDFATAFEDLDEALNNIKTNVISFRNGYAHGATPNDEQCESDIKQFEPFLNTLLSLPWLNESTIEAIEGKVHLKNETDSLNLHPIIAYRVDETEQPFVFFNDLKNDKVGLLNYPLSKHYRDKSFFCEFNQYLPLQDWKKTGSNIFNQRIEELTETFKGRLIERAAIKNFVITHQKGFLSIQGNPGIGKSALIAQVYKDLTNSEEKLPIQLVEYFIRRGTPQAEVSFLINHLLKKTDELFPAGKEIRAEGQTTWELQQQLYNKWTAFGDTDSPFKIIFLIDGLDEGVENDILKYLPRETFNNILFIYGSRPGGHQQLEKFWGELPIEQHEKIELGGLSKEDIRALLYEVANKYEIDKDSKWIDYLQQRSQGNPLYLKLLCNAIEEGSIAINDFESLPKEIDDYYKAILQRYAKMPDGDHLLNSLFVFAAARDYLTPMHLSEILGFGPATQTNVMSTLVEVLYENPMTENVLDYQLFHESLREYLKKDRSTEVAKAEQKIIEFCVRWKTLEGHYEQQYILKHYAAHLSTQQNETHHHTLIALTKDAEFIATQKKALRNFEATHQLYQYGIEVATKNNWNEAAIDSGLGIVDIKYEEQNDVTAILEMVKQNEMELALQRITALGGPSKEDKQRQFIVIMLCIMELTLLESKTQPWRKNAIEKLLGLMEEQIPVDHSVLNWSEFFSSYVVFLIAFDFKKMDLSYTEIYKRTEYTVLDVDDDKLDIEWIKNKGPYSVSQMDLLIQITEGIKDDFYKSSMLKEITVVLAKQGEIEKSLETVGLIINNSEKKSALKEIAIVLANKGEIEKSLQITEGINDDYKRILAILEISILLANHGDIIMSSKLLERLIQTAEVLKDNYEKKSVFKEIALVLESQGKLLESDILLDKSIQIVEELIYENEKCCAFLEIADSLAIRGRLFESNNLIEKSIQIAEGMTDFKRDSNEKCNIYASIGFLLDRRGKLPMISKILEKWIEAADSISDEYEKSYAYTQIAYCFAKQGEVEKFMQTVKSINYDFDKNSVFKEFAVVLAKQGNIETSIQATYSINDDNEKKTAFEKIAVESANNGKLKECSKILEKSLSKVVGINDNTDVLIEISKMYANLGFIDKSIDVIEAMKYDISQNECFVGIALLLANRGDFEKSIHLAGRIIYSHDKDPVFKEIAVLLANQGEIEKSIMTVGLINYNSDKNSAFKEIAIVLAYKGDIKESIQMIEIIIDDYEKALALNGIAVVLANQGKLAESSKIIEKSIQIIENLKNESQKSLAYAEIALLFVNQGKLAEGSILIEKSIRIAEDIVECVLKNTILMEIVIVLAHLGNIEKSVQIAECINDKYKKISFFYEISLILINQGKFEESTNLIEKSIQAIEGVAEYHNDYETSAAYNKIALLLTNQVNFPDSINLIKKINGGADRMQAWLEIGKVFYKKHQLLNLHQTLSQLPNDEAVTFFKKGIAQSITATNATEETILEILPLVKADKESTEHLLQMHALYCSFIEKTTKEKIQKFNRSLNIQWALDIIAKFPKEENVLRLSTNLDEWIEEVADEDDRVQIEIWARQVVKGKITEEEFGEKVKGMG